MIDIQPIDREIMPSMIWRVRYDGDVAALIPAAERCVDSRRVPSIYLETGSAASSSTSNLQPHNMPEFKAYYNWLGPVARHIITEKWGCLDPAPYYIDSTWCNRHDRTGRTEAHTHGLIIAAVATYLSVPKDSGGIEFKDPHGVHWRSFPRQSGDNKRDDWRRLDVEPGDTLIFPGWLEHRTEQHLGQEGDLRWVLTTNIGLRQGA